MVVDVAVERSHDVRTGVDHRRPFHLVAVERMRVRLGDDPDTGPPGVAEHRRSGIGSGQRPAQQIVTGDSRPQCHGVVTEFTDLGSGLVHEREHAVCRPHRTRLVRRVVCPIGDGLAQGRLVEIERVPADEHVDPGRITATHLEPIERRQRLLDREVPRQRSDARVAAGQGADLTSGAEPIVAQGPEHVTKRE